MSAGIDRGPDAAAGRRVDLNADVGAGYADDALMPYITSASIACGAHAGSAATMQRTIALAREHAVSVGAHPGFPDPSGFGRRVTTRDPAAIEALVVAQVDELRRHADALEVEVTYVKPHGALYNLAAADPSVARAIARAAQRCLPGTRLVLLAGSRGLAAVAAESVVAVAEGFVDRGYLGSGDLAPRGTDGASIEDAEEAARRAVALALESRVTTVEGAELTVAVDTLCLHGDGAHAAAIARRVRERLDAAGVAVIPFTPFVR